jgi:TRAP-type C4-dicarboxylate transport system permease small subunit
MLLAIIYVLANGSQKNMTKTPSPVRRTLKYILFFIIGMLISSLFWIIVIRLDTIYHYGNTWNKLDELAHEFIKWLVGH